MLTLQPAMNTISSFQEAIVKAAASAASTPSKLSSLPSPPTCSPISPEPSKPNIGTLIHNDVCF